MEALEAGELKVDTKDLLRAAQLKKEFQLKERDQEMAFAEMIYHFASGENKESRSYDRKFVEGTAVTNHDAAPGATGVDRAGADGPGPVYHTITWDAITQGTGQVPVRDDPAPDQD